MRRTFLHAAAALAMLGAVLPAGSASASSPVRVSAPGDGQLTFGVQASGPKKPDQRPYFGYSVTPGAAMNDNVAVLNYSEKPVTFSVYASDAFNTQSGGFDLLTKDKTPKDVGTWVKLAKNTITVPARGTAIMPFNIVVPANVTPGDHVGGIVASVPTQVKDASGNVITVDQRVGLRVYLRVAGALHPELKIESATVSYRGSWNPFGSGAASIQYTVRNVGNVRLAAHQAVRIGNVFGTTLRGTGFEALPELLPGNAYTVVVPVKSISQAFRTTATITVDPTAVGADSDPKADPVSATASFWAIPWTLIILIALLIAVLIAAWRWLTARSQVRRMQRGQA